MRLGLKILFAACAAWVLIGCSNDKTEESVVALESLRFGQLSYTLASDQSVTVEVYARAAGGAAEFKNNPEQNFFAVALSVVDPTVASVSSDGVLTGLKDGTTTLMARSPYYDGYATAEVIVEGIVPLAVASLRFEQSSYEVDAASVQPRLLIRMNDGSAESVYNSAVNPYSVVWSVETPSVASVSATGVVTRLKAGTTTLTATTAYYSKPVTTSVTFSDQTPTIASLRFEQSSYNVYTTTVQPRLMIRMSNESTESAYDAATNPYSVVWSVGTPSVASVSATGVVTRVAVGTTTLTATTSAYGTPVTTSVTFAESSSDGWVGEWVLASWSADQTLAGKIYMQLAQNNSFTLYQMVNTQGFAKLTGTYSVQEQSGVQVLTGTYTDGTSFGDSYTISAAAGKLTMTGRTTGYVSVYDTTTIPDYVKDGATVSARTRSMFTPFL